MLSAPQPVPYPLTRRCLSYSDLAKSYGGRCSDESKPSYDSSSDSDCENPQPIKRSRSDQSLTATAQLAAHSSSSSSGGAADRRQYGLTSINRTYGAAQRIGGAGGVALGGAPFARAQRAPSLPVVLSDVGSSTNSLLSLDSEGTRSVSQQHLNLLVSQPVGGQQEPSPVAAQHTLPLARSVSSSVAEAVAAALNGQTPVVTSIPHAGSREHSSSGFLCSLNPVSSAASLTQAQLWARGYDLTRTTSDASLSSGGYSAALQQLGLPLVAYSPPPLLSPGPPQPLPGSASADADTTSVMDALYGPGGALGLAGCSAGSFKPGMSIQQLKQASFQGPTAPASSAAGNVVMTAALGSSSWGMRAVNSRDSLHSSESITSVEAGERLAGVRFGLHPRPASGYSHSHTPSPHLKQGAVTALGQLPPLSPAYPGTTTSCELAEKRSTSLGNLGTATLGPAAGSSSRGGAGFGRPPVPAGSVVSPAPGAHSWGGSNLMSPGLQSEPSETASLAPGASPSVELQSMGSVLGDDGQWLFAELSTGAIGALSPTAPMAQQQSHGTQLQQHQPVAGPGPHSSAAGAAAQQQPTTSMAMAPAPVSRALPASSGMAPSCSLPIMPGATGAFGFGAAPAGAAAAAAAARLCLFDGSFGASPHAPSISLAAQHSRGLTASMPPPAGPLPQVADSSGRYSSSGGGGAAGGNRGLSAPLPHLLPGRGSMCGTAGVDGLMRLDSLQQPYRPSLHDASQWSFSRRHASFDCARTSLSSRRRGSLELNMPWRKTLDAAIAKAAAESGTDAAESPRSAAMDSSRGHGSSRDASFAYSDADTAVETAAGEADATFGSGAVAPPWQRPDGSSQLDLLMPLPEVEDESLASPCVCGPGSIGPGSMVSGGGRRSYDADVSSAASSHSGRLSSSSGGSIAADHDLPGSTNIGGYIGGSDSLGLSRHSLDSPTAMAVIQAQRQRNSYGLEFDGAVVMETVALGTSPLKHGGHALHQQQQQGGCSAASLHSMQQQQQLDHRHAPEQVTVVTMPSSGESTDDDDYSSSDADADSIQLPGVQQQVQPSQLAGKRSTREASRSAAAGAEASSMFSAPSSALGLEGPMLEMQGSQSASSISSRGSPGFYSRRGVGNGASRDLELFVRLNRARQTLDFAKRQAQAFAELDRAELTVWEALELLDSQREYEAGLLHAAASSGSGGGAAQEDAQLTPDMSLKEHAFQVAELCRLTFPDKPWMALVGLLHGLGKLLAHPMWGNQPQWAVAGESFPVGCKFAPQISASEFFSANPDRRRRTYSTALGVYQEQCGLRNVYMSWGAAEYLYMLLVLNQTQLPEEALSMLRYQRCYALTRPGGAYRQLMSAEDFSLLPTLATFQHILQYRRVVMPPGTLQGQALYDYYNGLINTYLGEEALFW